MTLSDKEIALELTKITVEHFNIRVAQSIRQSGLTEETSRPLIAKIVYGALGNKHSAIK